jgi:hypothetical protein
VDGQSRDSQNWLVDLDELGDKFTVLGDIDSTSNTEIAIKPRMPAMLAMINAPFL